MSDKRNTIQRKLVLEAVQHLKCHASAEEVHQYIVKNYPHISLATVYRNLDLLADEGLIGKVNNSDGKERFDHLSHRHYHIRCIKCGKLYDADMDYINDLDKKIRDFHGFEINTHDIIFNGVCPSCLKKKKKGG